MGLDVEDEREEEDDRLLDCDTKVREQLCAAGFLEAESSLSSKISIRVWRALGSGSVMSNGRDQSVPIRGSSAALGIGGEKRMVGSRRGTRLDSKKVSHQHRDERIRNVTPTLTVRDERTQNVFSITVCDSKRVRKEDQETTPSTRR